MIFNHAANDTSQNPVDPIDPTIPPGSDGLYAWGDQTALSNCGTYQFPIQRVNGVALPASPTLNTQILDTMTPIIPSNSCVYGDQMNIAQYQHTCVVVQDGSNPYNTCVKNDGTIASLGETEVFYDNSLCSNDPCPETIVSVAVNSYPQITRPYCLTGTNANELDIENNPFSNLSMFLCDAGPAKQFLYEEVDNQGDNYSIPNILTPITLTLRMTGQCVVPGGFSSSVTYPNTGYNPGYPSSSDQCARGSVSLILNQYYANLASCTNDDPTWFWLPSYTFTLNGNTFTNPRQLIYLPPLIDAMSSLDPNISGPDFMNWLAGRQSVYALAWTADVRHATTASLALNDECITRGWKVQMIDWYANT